MKPHSPDHPPSHKPGDNAWFAAKRHGYGAERPVTWQGWAVLLGYLAIVIGTTLLAPHLGKGLRAGCLAIVFAATIALIRIASRRTRGGWKWRWGETQ